MVTNRSGGDSFAGQQRKTTDYIFDKVGRKDITLTKHTQTVNSRGRLSGYTDVTPVNIQGDMQFVTVQDKQWLELGYAKLGDGILYVKYDADIDPEDDVTVDGVNWHISKQVEGETINGNLIYQAWICVRTEEG